MKVLKPIEQQELEYNIVQFDINPDSDSIGVHSRASFIISDNIISSYEIVKLSDIYDKMSKEEHSVISKFFSLICKEAFSIEDVDIHEKMFHKLDDKKDIETKQ